MRLKPTLRYQMWDYMKGVLTLLLVFIGILIFLGGLTALYGGENYFQGYSFMAFLFMFVCGIAVPREHLRLGIQMGVSRRTSFLGNVLSAFLAACLLSLFNELAGMIIHSVPLLQEIQSSDLYAMIYLNGSSTLSPAQHGISILFHWALLSAIFFPGMFLTLLFWRLSRNGTIVAAILIALLPFGIALTIYRFQESLSPLIYALSWIGAGCAQSPWFFMALCLVCAAVLGLVSWLLVRKVYIQGT